jgi:hypothetical protein
MYRTLMRTLLPLLLPGTVVVLTSGCPPVNVPTGEVRGTIIVHGYDLNPGDLMVRARPLPGEGKAGVLRPVVVNATRAAGGLPSQFEFRLTGLARDVPYRIGVKIANQETALYPRLVWNVDRDPMVLAGDAPLRFDAYAVLSEIEVMGSEEGRDRAAWVAADALDFTDPALATRTFRWRTALSNITGGQLQVSLQPFPRIGQTGYDPCAESEDGIVYTQDFTRDVVPGEWVTLPAVDFHALLYRAGKALPEGAAELAAATPNWDTQFLPKLEAGHPLYVRVMPRSGEETVCGPEEAGVPPEVLLARIILKILEHPEALDPKISLGQVWYTKPDYGARPYPGETCYRVTKDHKVLFLLNGGTVWDMLVANHMSGVTYGNTALRGKSFCVPPDNDDDGWLESFTDSFGAVLTGIVDALGDIVNYTSKLWEEIQDEVVDAAASVIDNFVDCGQGSICRSALETGLEIGLATMGVPPSLPNFDELVDQGVEYLAAQVAAQTGIPSVLTDYAAQEAKDFVQDVVKNMKANYDIKGLPNWLAPDIRFESAYLVMELYGRGKTLPFDSTPSLIRNNGPIYAGVLVGLPRNLPKKNVEPPLLFPMVLPPNTYGLPPAPPTTVTTFAGSVTFYPNEYDKAVWNKNVWITQRYANGCYALHLTALSDPGGIYKVLSAKFKTEDSSVPCP